MVLTPVSLYEDLPVAVRADSMTKQEAKQNLLQ
jgi:hypothetical protein